MQLSKRLQMVTDFVTPGSVVADVGCDHAYISIYLILNGIALRTYALDINRGPLKKAKANIEAKGLEDRITTILSDGLSNLEPGKADSIIIAGMGGALAVKILTEGYGCVVTSKELIIQAQSELDKVRMYLHTIDYDIIEENMCKDDGKYYTAIHAVKKSNQYVETIKNMEATKAVETIKNVQTTIAVETTKDVETTKAVETTKDFDQTVNMKTVYLKYGKYLLQTRHPVLLEFLKKEFEKANEILGSLKKQNTENTQTRILSLLEEIKLLEEALAYFI